MVRKWMLVFFLVSTMGVGSLFAQAETNAQTPMASAKVSSVVVGKDTDKDGMPDAWEKKMGLNFRNRFDAKLDPDGDKVKNIDEYKAGTNPRDKDIDKNKDGVADDWMKFYGLTDIAADADGDGVSNKKEYEAGTDPKDAKSFPKDTSIVESKRMNPSMAGVSANEDKSIPDNHEIRKNVFKYNDPIGDDKGPGYYQYPTNPVYSSGAFDITSFEVDATGKDNIVFKITVNADLKQDWGMAADFDIQHFQIYIDTDGVPGSGEVKCIPGLNVYFDPQNAWDRAVIITPQPSSRVQVELDVKAKEMEGNVVIPSKISGQGRTIIAVVSRKALGVGSDADISKWAYQVIAQSNEGFPDPGDVLTRNVNEFRGLHRFGNGSDYSGDPEVIDILTWPAKGTLQEAKDQFAIMNVWESYPDPKMDVHTVLPLIRNNETEQWSPKGGYIKFAKDLSKKIKPPAQKDKYVSDNYTLAGSVNAQWYYNMDNTTATPSHPATFGGGGLSQTFKPEAYYDNHIYSRYTLEWYGKAFTDLVNFYSRVSTWWGPDAQWDYWMGNYYRDSHGPQYVSLDFEAFRFQLVRPIPTVDYISIGNYEYGLSAWTVGKASYPDRDKFKGIFLDGSTEVLGIKYNLAWFYPFPWLGLNWALGNYTARDNVISGMVAMAPVKGLKFQVSGDLYNDRELGSVDSTSGLRGDVRRLQNAAADGDLAYSINLGATTVGIDAKGGYSMVWRGTNKSYDPNTALSANNSPVLSTGGPGLIGNTNDFYGYFGVGTLKVGNIGGAGLNFKAQGFYIKDYYSIMAARGDYGNAASQDVLMMFGNQAAHAYPNDAAGFQKYDAVMWESVAADGWYGGTGILEWAAGLLNLHTEFSAWKFNSTNYNNELPSGITNGQLTTIVSDDKTITNISTNNIIPYSMRGYAEIAYRFGIGNGLDLKLSYLFNGTKNWWPMTAQSQIRLGMGGSGEFMYGFQLYDSVAKLMGYYQFTKVFSVGVGFQFRYDVIHDLYPLVTEGVSPDYIVKGYTGILDFQYSTPLGTLRSYIQGYITDNPRNVAWAQTRADFRVPMEYFGNEFNVVALTELDIHF